MTDERLSAPERQLSAREALERIDAALAGLLDYDSRLEPLVEAYRKFHRHRLAFDLRTVARRFHSSAAILEVGGAPFVLTGALAKIGYRIRCVDVDPERFAKFIECEGLDIQKIDIERQSLPYSDRGFDLVLFNEVFEHLRVDPIFTLSEVHRVMKPGGTLLLSTPNMRSMRGLWMLLVKHTSSHAGRDLFTEYGYLRQLGHMGHVREYTAREVEGFLERIGFAIHATHFRHSHPPATMSWGTRLKQLAELVACAILPSWKGMMTVVARRPDAPSSTPETRIPHA